jgi:ABC-type Mn2+/Zn2+ transport system ATPase subunit
MSQLTTLAGTASDSGTVVEASSEAALEAIDLTVHYDDRLALASATLALAPGEVVALLGPNGAGKSTLLRVLAGMLAPSHGEVRFRGEPLRGTDPAITYVPQRAGADWTFPIPVREAVLLGLARRTPRWRPFGRDERRRADDVLDQVGLRQLAHVQIGELSGGQQQRVFLARALLGCGAVLLLDEPFTGVDVPTQRLFGDIFADLKRRGTLIVYATHDLGQARQTADRIVLINGRLIASGPPSEATLDGALRETFGGQVIVLRDEASQGHRIRPGDTAGVLR